MQPGEENDDSLLRSKALKIMPYTITTLGAIGISIIGFFGLKSQNAAQSAGLDALQVIDEIELEQHNPTTGVKQVYTVNASEMAVLRNGITQNLNSTSFAEKSETQKSIKLNSR